MIIEHLRRDGYGGIKIFKGYLQQVRPLFAQAMIVLGPSVSNQRGQAR